jgi:glycosyltransferase involved in cell wall biosynthesis
MNRNAALPRARHTKRLRALGDPSDPRTGARVSVVIPTLNEAANLPHVMSRIPNWVHEVLIVDGRSIDDTVAVARALWPSVRIILQDGRGKGNALACGFGAAVGEIIVMLDADGSTDPAEIPQFVQPLLDGADFAKGSRCIDGAGSADLSPLRSAGNRVLTGLFNTFYGRQYSDLCYGYNAFWSRCLQDMRVDCDGFEVETLIHVRIARAGRRVKEVPSMEHQRLSGESNLRAFRDGWRVLRTMVAGRFARSPQNDAAQWIPPIFQELADQLNNDSPAQPMMAEA